MKKFNLFLAIFVVTFAIGCTKYDAASKCNYDDQVKLGGIASNIKVAYEEAEALMDKANLLPGDNGEIPDTYYNYFKITVYNITEDVFIKVSNDYNDEVKYLRYEDTQSGVATFDWLDINSVVNFTFTVYSSDKTACANEEYQILYLTTPRYNSYSTTADCADNTSFYLCQKYITETEDVDYTTFFKKLESFESGKPDEKGNKKDNVEVAWNEKLLNFVKENKIPVIIVSTIIVGAGVISIVLVNKKRRSRLI